MNETATEVLTDIHQMKCMEIWGGMSAADARISTGGLDVHVVAQPHGRVEAGGDVHYLSTCGAGNISRFLLADVAGHGQNVAELADDLRQLMRRFINNPDASRMAHALNDEFSELAKEGKFATAIIATYFAPTNQLIMVNAGHPRPLWYQAAQKNLQTVDGDDEDCDVTGPKNLPLGVISGTDYEQFAITLTPGDLLMFYTDSLTETAGPDGQMLGEQGLLDIARSIDAATAEQAGPALLERIDRLRGRTDADDDLTLLTIHHNGVPPQIGFGERLAAMAKMVGLVPV